MQAAPYLFVPPVLALSLAAAYSVAGMLGRKGRPQRANHLFTALMCAALGTMGLRASAGTVAPLIWAVGAGALWFIVQAARQRTPNLQNSDSSRGFCLYRGALMGLCVWILITFFSGAGPGRLQDLGFVLSHLIAAIILTFAAAAWLLATFAMPREGMNRSTVPRLRGIHEALMAISIAALVFGTL
jgi:hypothetical protein